MFERYVRFIVRHRRAVIVATLLLVAAVAPFLRSLHFEIRRRANLPADHVYVKIQNRISDLFGGEAVVIIGVVATHGDIYTPQILGKVSRITDRVRDIPGVVDSSVFSLAAPHVKSVTTAADGSLDIHTLMNGEPESAEEIARIRDEVRRDRFFRGNLVSEDETATLVVGDFDDTLTDTQLAARIAAAVDPERDDSVVIALAGAPILRAALADYTKMIGILFPLAVFVIAVVHYEAFRTLQAMVLPLCTALLSVILALSLMGFLGLPMDTWSALTPVLILAIAAGHAVQILKRYYEEYARVGDTDEAVVRALTAVGPVMLTAGTIASAGFASLTSFGVTSVRVFGLLLASGIISALFIEMTFVPACRSLLPPPRQREMNRERERRRIDRILDRLADGVTRHPLATLATVFGVVAAIGLGMGFIAVDNSVRLWFAPSTQVRIDDRLLNEKLPGTATLRVLIEGEEPGVLKDPAVLRAMRDFETYIDADDNLGGVTSIVDHIERIHQAMNGGRGEAYDVPDTRKLVEQYLFLYEMTAGPDGLTSFVDPDYRYAVVRALSKTDRAAFSRDLLARLDSFAAKRFENLPVRVEIAGGTLGVQTALNDEVVHEKIDNVIQVSAIILILCALVLRSFVGGLFVLVPLACAVIVNLGIMGWAGIWLDMTTAAITAMGVSIGADFAIYLIFRIREQRRAGADLVYAVREALQTSGKAIFFVSSAVVVGYLVLPFSGFSVWVRLGCLTALIVGVSALATLTVIPALALLFEPRFLNR